MKGTRYKRMGVCLFLSICTLGLLAINRELSEEPKITSAHPSTEIKIDKDMSYEFVVPTDAAGTVESTMPAGFVQSDAYYYRFKKENINAFAEQYYSSATYSQTYFQNRIPINDTYDALIVFGYGTYTNFGGVTAIMVDKEGNIVKDAAGKSKLVRSSPTAYPISPAGYAHQAGPGGILKYSDGTFGLISGPYNEKAVYVTRFDENFNTLQKTSVLSITANANLLEAMAPYGGYTDDEYAYLQVHRFGAQTQAAVIKLNLETQAIESKDTYQIPAPSLFGYSGTTQQNKVIFGGYDYKTQFMDTADGGRVGAVNYTQSNINKSTFAVVKWDADGNMEYWAKGPEHNYAINRFSAVLGISDDDYFYYWVNGERDAEAKLMRIDLNNPGTIGTNKQITPEVMKVLPKESLMQIQPEQTSDTYFFQGYISEVTEEFARVGVTAPGVVLGQMNKDFEVISAQTAEATGYTWFTTFEFDQTDPRKIYVEGSTTAKDFADEEFQTLYNSKNFNHTFQLAFWGNMTAFKNHAPGIKVNTIPPVNVTDYATSQAFDDNLLSYVEVTDTFDLDQSADGGGHTQAELDARVNRNPNKLDAAIDWSALGLDKEKAGPQLTTFFVTDHTLLSTATSAYVNTVTDETIMKDDYALDAHNFAIPLTEVSTITDEEAFKTLAKTLAWNLNTYVIDEDSQGAVFDGGKVTVDAAQLAALQQATAAKPYPVDVTYSPDPQTTIVNRVWVFATTKNTVVNKDTGVVIYGDDYTIPLYAAADETKQDVYSKGVIRVYDYYDANHETDADCIIVDGKPELPALADQTNTTALDIVNLPVITDAVVAETVQPRIHYVSPSGEVTEGTIDVTLTASVLLHVRQVIVQPETAVISPTEGFLTLVNSASRRINLTMPSGPETGTASTEPDYKTFIAALDTAAGNNFLTFHNVIPEYYTYVGYVASDSQLPAHNSAQLTGTGNYRYELVAGDYEKWVTIYLTPATEQPQQYSWDYKENDIGTINVP